MSVAGEPGAPAETETERLFVAFWPDTALRGRLEELAAASIRKAGARPVAPDNLHVTLVFIGNWPVAARDQAERVVDALDIPAEDLVFDRIVRWRKAGVVSLVTDEVPAALVAYQRDVASGLAAAGWTPEPRPWRPHVTLGRKAQRPVREELEEPLFWRCGQVALVRSENDGSGSVYRPLRVWER